MKSSQSVWCLSPPLLDVSTTQIKNLSENYSDGLLSSSLLFSLILLFSKSEVSGWGGVEAEKVHFTSQKSKDLPTYKLWQVGKYRYIQYQRSLRCYPTIFSLEGAGGVCASVLKCFILWRGRVGLQYAGRVDWFSLWRRLIQVIVFFIDNLMFESRADVHFLPASSFVVHCDWEGKSLKSHLLLMMVFEGELVPSASQEGTVASGAWGGWGTAAQHGISFLQAPF